MKLAANPAALADLDHVALAALATTPDRHPLWRTDELVAIASAGDVALATATGGYTNAWELFERLSDPRRIHEIAATRLPHGPRRA